MDRQQMIIGIGGGIGSGKSVVSRILRELGYDVYDCDMEARRIMNESSYIKRRIRDEISPDVTDGDRIPDRKRLADIVFSNEDARKRLNSIVHGAVRKDIMERCGRLMWVEAAILAESGIADMCDEIWSVEAPFEMRVRRITARDRCMRRQALRRVASQSEEERLLQRYSKIVRVIHNDSRHSLIEQVELLLRKLPCEDSVDNQIR